MKKTYKLYAKFLLKGLGGIAVQTLFHTGRGIYLAFVKVKRLVATYKYQTALIGCFLLAGLNVFQLVHGRVESLKMESRCDSLLDKSRQAKVYYDRGYNDGLKYTYKGE